VAGIERYAYDGHGWRVRADSLQGAGSILSQYDITGRLMWQTDERDRFGKLHVYFGDRLFAIREQSLVDGSTRVRYLHTDAEGTPVAETDHTGALLRRSEHEPFGKLLNRPETQGVTFRGHVADRMTGLFYTDAGYRHPLLPGVFDRCVEASAWIRCRSETPYTLTRHTPIPHNMLADDSVL
jgi:hypothetical protein